MSGALYLRGVMTVNLGDPGAVSGGGKKAKRARKKFGRRKVKSERRSPWDSSLNRPVPKPFKILACDWAQKISESSSFRVTFVTSYSIFPAPTNCPWVSEDDCTQASTHGQ